MKGHVLPLTNPDLHCITTWWIKWASDLTMPVPFSASSGFLGRSALRENTALSCIKLWYLVGWNWDPWKFPWTGLGASLSSGRSPNYTNSSNLIIFKFLLLFFFSSSQKFFRWKFYINLFKAISWSGQTQEIPMTYHLRGCYEFKWCTSLPIFSPRYFWKFMKWIY